MYEVYPHFDRHTVCIIYKSETWRKTGCMIWEVRS